MCKGIVKYYTSSALPHFIGNDYICTYVYMYWVISCSLQTLTSCHIKSIIEYIYTKVLLRSPLRYFLHII